MICPECQAENPAQARYCMQCSSRLPLTCANCGTALPQEARFCLHCAAPLLNEEPKALEAALPNPKVVEEDRRLVTILFADLVDWTSVAAKMDPEDVRHVQTTYFDTMTPAIRKYGGRVEKYIGDAVLAVFGVPRARELDPENALRAGLAMQSAWETVRRDRDQILPRMRIGIHTGRVVASMGEQDEDFLVTGDAVNLASRIEGIAPPGGVLISEATFRHLNDMIDVEVRAPAVLKGQNNPVQTYRVLGLRPPPFQPIRWTASRIRTPMIGREEELSRIQTLFEATGKDSRAQMVTIIGEAGVGKSRLLSEFQVWLHEISQPFVLFRGRALPETQQVPFSLIRELINAHFDIQESDSLEAQKAKLEQGMLEILSPSDDLTASDNEAANPRSKNTSIPPLVGQLLGYDFSTSPQVATLLDEPEAIRSQGLSALAEFFQAQAMKEVVVILLEDLHWADQSSLMAITHLVDALPRSAVMVVGAGRPEFLRMHPARGSALKPHVHLNLNPLADEATRLLVRDLLQRVGSIPDKFISLIVSRTEGNPFYVEELLMMFVEDGVVETAREPWQIRMERLSEAQVPATLTGVLQARLDRLSPEVRLSLQQASVVGRYFWDQALEFIQRALDENRDLDQVLASLQAREIVFPREVSDFSGAREYFFKHAIFRDVTYKSLLRRVRRDYHGLAADWLVSVVGDRLDQFSGQIADHLEMAGRTDEAVEYFLRAGDMARNLYSHAEAIDYYQRALAIFKERNDANRAARTLMKLGLTFNNAFEYQQARQAYQEGFEIWGQVQDEIAPHAPAPHPLRLIVGGLNLPNPLHYYGHRGLTFNLFSGLVHLSPELDVLPDVAYRWEVLDQGQRYLFHLREDVYWTDGVPVTAEDFAFTLKKILDPATQSDIADMYLDIKGAKAFNRGQDIQEENLGIRALDPATFEIELEEPAAYFLQLMAILLPVPRHMIAIHDGAWNEPQNLVTNGAFRLEIWKPEADEVLLTKNDHYHGRSGGNLRQVQLFQRKWPPQVENLEMYKSDELDVLDLADIPIPESKKARNRLADELMQVPMLMITLNGFNTRKPPFDRLEVRQAFALALDQEEVTNKFVPDYVFPATGGYIPPGMPGHSPGIGHPFDPERARQLLAQAGYPGGQDLPAVNVVTFYGHNEIGDYILEEWRRHLGATITREILPWEEFLARLEADPPQLWLGVGHMAEYPDPDNLLRVQLSRDRAGWRHETYERLIEEARGLTDQKARMRLYRQADKILIEETILLPLFYSREHYFIKPWVKRFPISPLSATLWKDVVLDPQQEGS